MISTTPYLEESNGLSSAMVEPDRWLLRYQDGSKSVSPLYSRESFSYPIPKHANLVQA